MRKMCKRLMTIAMLALCLCAAQSARAVLSSPTVDWVVDVTASHPNNFQGSAFYKPTFVPVPTVGTGVLLGQIGEGMHLVDLSTGALLASLQTNNDVKKASAPIGNPPLGAKSGGILMPDNRILAFANDHAGAFSFDYSTLNLATHSLANPSTIHGGGVADMNGDVPALPFTGGAESATSDYGAIDGTFRVAYNLSQGIGPFLAGRNWLRTSTITDTGTTITQTPLVTNFFASPTGTRIRGIGYGEDQERFYFSDAGDQLATWNIMSVDAVTLGPDRFTAPGFAFNPASIVATYMPPGTDMFLGGAPRAFDVEVHDDYLFVAGTNGYLTVFHLNAAGTGLNAMDPGPFNFDLVPVLDPVLADLDATNVQKDQLALFGVNVTDGPGVDEYTVVVTFQTEFEEAIFPGRPRRAAALVFDASGVVPTSLSFTNTGLSGYTGTGVVGFDQPAQIPEPTALALLSMACAAMGVRRRRNRTVFV